MTDYGYSVEVPEGYDEAIMRTRLALKGEGFSIITEMHVGGLLGPEAGLERQYMIMGSWDASVVQTLGDDTRVAIHLPCNFVVQESGASALVAALDPADTLDEGVLPDGVTDAARAALGRVLTLVRSA